MCANFGYSVIIHSRPNLLYDLENRRNSIGERKLIGKGEINKVDVLKESSILIFRILLQMQW